MKLGIIQSRGLGDIIISLPIAHNYYKQGWEIHWPISREFIPDVANHVPWVNWHAVTTDHGPFFLEQPRKIFRDLKIDQELVLYQALTGEEFHHVNYFQHTKFDQYKYIKAGVNFLEKWQLNECITRNTQREQELFDLVTNQLPNNTQDYILVHLEGSDHRADFDISIIPDDKPAVEITRMTDSIFDWLMLLEKAWAVILTDSVFSNLVDQLGLQTAESRYFIPRSHIGLTPVLGHTWTWLDNQNLDKRSETIRVNG